ncbi:MAG: class I SAM-dependent methyltransferase [Moorea sp. SIO2B7]|nr:class I SAM-dependent methyltransferase [Moorena sp. SIO2B7]
MKIKDIKFKYLIPFISNSIKSRSILNSYNLNYSIYDKLFFNQQAKFTNYIINYLKNHNYTNALDLCCGTGILTICLLNIADTVTGIDFSTGMIKTAKEKANTNNIEFKIMDILDMNSQDEYDLITMLGAFSHFNENQLNILLSKIHKAMKNNSIFIIGITPFPWNNNNCFSGSLFDKVMSKLYNLFMAINGLNERRYIYSFDSLKIFFNEHNLRLNYIIRENLVILEAKKYELIS